MEEAHKISIAAELGDDTGHVSRIMKGFKDRATKQAFELHHSMGNSSLPARFGGEHPATALMSRKVLTCRKVSAERTLATADMYGLADSLALASASKHSPPGADESVFREEIREAIRLSKNTSSAEPSEEEMDLLMQFVPLDEDNADVRLKLNLALTLWGLSNREWPVELPRLLPLQKAQLLAALTLLNSGESVQYQEAVWVAEKFRSLPSSPQVELRKLQITLAYWYAAPQARPAGGLRRRQLLQRVELEGRLWSGLLSFTVWTMVFVLSTLSLIISGSLEQCRSISGNLEVQLALHEASDITSLEQVRKFAKSLTGRMKAFVPLARGAFQAGEWTLQDEPKRFTEPIKLPEQMEPEPNLDGLPPVGLYFGNWITFQAWVRYEGMGDLPQHGLSILRKSVPGSAGELSCWDWRFPPALVFGAHDYGPSVPNGVNGNFEEYIQANYSNYLTGSASSWHLHTLLIDNGLHEAKFMVDDAVWAVVPLPRSVTDCKSSDITMGDAALSLASVRFFPTMPISESQVAQIYTTGASWADIGETIGPQRMKAMSGDDVTEATALATAAKMEAAVRSAREDVLAAGSFMAMEPPAAPQPYSNEEHEMLQKKDSVTGDLYWEIFSVPMYMDPTSKISSSWAPGPLGFTVSSWVKLSNLDGGFLMSLAAPLANTVLGTEEKVWTSCWGLWVGGNSTGVLVSSSTTGVSDSSLQVPTPLAWAFRGHFFRHFLFVIGPQELRVCIDGHCEEHAVDRDAASCFGTSNNETRLHVGQSGLGAYPLTAHQMSTKLFDRPLTKQEAWALFTKERDPTDARPIREARGCQLPGEGGDDATFRDGQGHGCDWYGEEAQKGRTGACHDLHVQEHCPVACRRLERCWGSREEEAVSFSVWRRQMEFRPLGRHGVMCVARSTTAAKEAIACAMRSAGKNCSHLEMDEGRLLECIGDAQWISEGLGCREIILSEGWCRWDDSSWQPMVDKINRKKAWSISFWFQSRTPRCAPQIRLLGAGGRPLAFFGAPSGAFVSKYQPGSGWVAECKPDDHLVFRYGNHDEAETPFSDGGSKHFVVMEVAQGNLTLYVDGSGKVKGRSIGSVPVGDDFLRVINIGGDLRISPLSVRASHLSTLERQNSMYSQRASQALRIGPSEPDWRTETVFRDAKSYEQKTILIAPPFILLKRSAKNSCQKEAWLQHLVWRGIHRKCSYGSSCDMAVQESLLSTCLSDKIAEGKYFGHFPQRIRGDVRYMEFLSAFTDASLVVRDGELKEMSEFVDVLTRDVEIVALFHSAPFRITSLLKIQFDTSKGRIQGKTSITHSVITSQPELHQCTALSAISVVVLFVLLLKLLWAVKKSCFTGTSGKTENSKLGDTIFAALCLAWLFTQMVYTASSQKRTATEMQNLIEFFSHGFPKSLDMLQKNYMRAVVDVEDALFTKQGVVSDVSAVFSILLLVRMVYTMNAHPRMELVTRTLELASSDLLHFALLMVIIFTGFALLGTWLFGTQREDFRNVVAALGTLLDSVLGPPGELPIFDEQNSPVEIAYVVIFHFLCFLFMLNFVLAIIVDSYTRVMQEVRDCTVEQSVVADIVAVFHYRWLKYKHSFPPRPRVLTYLGELGCQSVTVDDLWCAEEGQEAGIFKSQRDASAFYKHYAAFPFLVEEMEAKQEPSSDDLGLMAATIMQKLDAVQEETCDMYRDNQETKLLLRELMAKIESKSSKQAF